MQSDLKSSNNTTQAQSCNVLNINLYIYSQGSTNNNTMGYRHSTNTNTVKEGRQMIVSYYGVIKHKHVPGPVLLSTAKLSCLLYRQNKGFMHIILSDLLLDLELCTA
eukprot:286299_1